MARTKEELREIRKSVNELSTVLQELSEDELNEVFGGAVFENMGGQSVVGTNIFGDDLNESVIGLNAFGAKPAAYKAFLASFLGMWDESIAGRN